MNKVSRASIECLFGFHKYTIPLLPSNKILMSEVCRRAGYYKWPEDEVEIWTEYDEWGNEILYRTSNGYEELSEYIKEGSVVYYKDSFEVERWFDGETWVDKKPKNWKYEECLIK